MRQGGVRNIRDPSVHSLDKRRVKKLIYILYIYVKKLCIPFYTVWNIIYILPDQNFVRHFLVQWLRYAQATRPQLCFNQPPDIWPTLDSWVHTLQYWYYSGFL